MKHISYIWMGFLVACVCAMILAGAWGFVLVLLTNPILFVVIPATIAGLFLLWCIGRIVLGDNV